MGTPPDEVPSECNSDDSDGKHGKSPAMVGSVSVEKDGEGVLYGLQAYPDSD